MYVEDGGINFLCLMEFVSLRKDVLSIDYWIWKIEYIDFGGFLSFFLR